MLIVSQDPVDTSRRIKALPCPFKIPRIEEMKNTTKTQYKGWKSGMRSQGWVELQKKHPTKDEFYFIEEKTVGAVTVQRHRTMQNLFWLVNGKRFSKLKDAVVYADSLALSA